jgi:hypothetical protein
VGRLSTDVKTWRGIFNRFISPFESSVHTQVADGGGQFERHLDAQQCGSNPEGSQCQIYNVKMVLSWIKNSTGADAMLTAQNIAVDFVKERAVELGRQEWLYDPWGLSQPETRARRVCDSRR